MLKTEKKNRNNFTSNAWLANQLLRMQQLMPWPARSLENTAKFSLTRIELLVWNFVATFGNSAFDFTLGRDFEKLINALPNVF